jgi:hypothetical protein
MATAKQKPKMSTGKRIPPAVGTALKEVAPDLKAAGIAPKPLSERAWLWIKDHPDSSVNKVADALGEPRGNVSSVVSILTRRKMLTYREEIVGRGQGHGMPVRHYTAKGSTYVLLPIALDPPRGSKKNPPPPPPPAPVVELSIDQRMDKIADGLSVKEARCLYDKLKALLIA